jgi:tetratricopeptide (TPR) repeat protein
MLMAQGRLGDAAKELETNLEISQKLRDKFPKKGDLQHGVAVAHERLGFLRLKQRRWADAIEQYQEDLKVIDGLIESDSKNVTWLTDQAFANEGLGDVLRLRPNRNLQSALLYYKKYVEIVSSLTESDTSKSNVKLKRDLAVGYQRLGVTNLGMGLRDEARSDFQRCLSCSNGLVSPFDVRNPDPEDVREACRSQLESMTGK